MPTEGQSNPQGHSAQSPLPVPPLQSPPAKRRPFWRNLAIGCLGLIVLGCVGIGGAAYWDLSQNQQKYDRGHAAYLQGDCEAAVAAFNSLSNIENADTDNETTQQARAERSECRDYLAGVTLQSNGQAGDALLSYADFIDKYPQSPILPGLRQQVDQLYQGLQLVEMVGPDICLSLDGLLERELVVDPASRMPELLMACGAVFEATEDFTGAVNYYQRFRDEYADHPLIEQATAGLARAAVAEARAAGAGELPAPQAVGSSGGDSAVIVIQNDTPERLSLIFSGPDVRVETLEACAECSNFSSQPQGCPELGPLGRYTVAPGNYEVVVRSSSDAGVIPFRGSWSIGGGEEYYSCFFLVTAQ